MLKDLKANELKLAEYMSDLSEKAYYAGWMDGLEYALWKVVLGQAVSYGHLTIRPEDATTLRQLSDACGGWIVFDDETEETWVSLSDWKNRFSNWQQALSESG